MQKVRILVVEDETIVSLDIQRRLKTLGYEVVGAAVSGEDAINKAATHRPDLVLMDIMLDGDMDGVAAAEQIRGRLHIPVIYLTAYADAYTLHRAKVTEPFGYILKPFEERELHGHIEIALYKHRMELKLKESQERYMLAASAANDGLWDWDLRTHNIYLSSRWKSMIGFPEEEIGQHPKEWFGRLHPSDHARVKREFADHVKGRSSNFESEYRMLCKDGTYRWMLTRGMALRNQSGKAHRIAGSQTDITERKYYDPLTGMPNRMLFIDRIQAAVDNAASGAMAFAVLSISLGDLGIVVNSLAYANRDELMIQVARRLQNVLSSTQTAARLGEDNFGVLMTEIGGASEATNVATEIHKALSQRFQLRGQEFYLSASIGIAPSTTAYTAAEDVMRDADTAMHRAKTSGKNQIEVFDEHMRSHLAVRIQREADLRRAIDRQDLRVYYQPIIELNNGQIAGFEALIRWQHNDNLLLPKDFIPLAEQTGLIIPLEKFVLRTAMEQVCAWEAQLPLRRRLTVSVNLSAKHYSEPNLVEDIEKLLVSTGISARSLKLEITETALMDNKESVAITLHQLDNLQIELAMDDFGTGYSSLSYLHQFPIRSLKIDRCFVSKLGLKNASRKIVQTIVTLGKSLGMEVVAEGVENTRQIIELQAFDCTYAQGYLFSTPVTADAATLMLMQDGPWTPEANQIVFPTLETR